MKYLVSYEVRLSSIFMVTTLEEHSCHTSLKEVLHKVRELKNKGNVVTNIMINKVVPLTKKELNTPITVQDLIE